MAKIKHLGTVNGREKEFLKLFDQLTYSRSAWQTWEDLMTVMACSICNTVDRREKPFKKREEQYKRSIESLGGVEIPAQIFNTVVMALEENPNQDFLGRIYMSLDLGSHWRGQFFTPYHISELMARITISEGCQKEIEKKGYVSVYDPCVGAGAMLIAVATAFQEYKINYQTSVIFVGQDIDPVVAKMAYIQISLLGCAGYITVGDSLTNPQAGHVLFPEEKEGQELWITPLFMHKVWEVRRTKEVVLGLFGEIEATVKTVEKEHYFMFFDFKEKGLTMESKGCNGNDIFEQSKKALQSETWQKARKPMKFDVENKRLEKEDAWLMKNVEQTEAADLKEREDGTTKEETTDLGKKEAVPKVGEAQEEKLEDEAEKTSKERAKEKLEKEMRADKDKAFSEPVIDYLLERCKEDEGLAQDVIQEHKTWKKCFDYIYSQARKQAKGNCVAVRDDVVYEWAEDYYHKDDKAEEEKKAKKETERKAKEEEGSDKTASAIQRKGDVSKEQPKPKKTGKNMDGQLDMFSMMGM